MNTDSRSSVELAQGVAKGASGLAGDKVNVAVIPPFVYLQSVVKAVSSTGVSVGSQDVYIEPKGAFTGEVSAAMLKDVGCTYVLCGHSERRHVLGESDELVGKKVTASLGGGLLPILCVGELLAERDAGQTEAVVARHLKTGLAGLSADKMSAVTIAYEPVWAIGTGRTATPEQAQEVHVFVRKFLAEMFNHKLADEIRVLYGGSANAGNAKDLMAQKDVDGLLVGGASLKVDDFVKIIQAAV